MASQYRNKTFLRFSLPLSHLFWFLFVYFVWSSLTRNRVGEADLVAFIITLRRALSMREPLDIFLISEINQLR